MLVSVGFVFFGLVEFAFVILINRTSFGTQEKLNNTNVGTVRSKVTFKIGQDNRDLRITNKIRDLRCAMKKGSYETKNLDSDKVKGPTTIVRTKFMRSLQSVDIIACCVFLFLFVSFNCFYFFYYLSSHEICKMISNA